MICSKCGKDLPMTEYNKSRKRCKKCDRKVARKHARKLWKERKPIIDAYLGCVCVICGETDYKRLRCHEVFGRPHSKLLNTPLEEVKENCKAGKFARVCAKCHGKAHSLMKLGIASWKEICQLIKESLGSEWGKWKKNLIKERRAMYYNAREIVRSYWEATHPGDQIHVRKRITFTVKNPRIWLKLYLQVHIDPTWKKDYLVPDSFNLSAYRNLITRQEPYQPCVLFFLLNSTLTQFAVISSDTVRKLPDITKIPMENAELYDAETFERISPYQPPLFKLEKSAKTLKKRVFKGIQVTQDSLIEA
jgi:hypothetical protein